MSNERFNLTFKTIALVYQYLAENEITKNSVSTTTIYKCMEKAIEQDVTNPELAAGIGLVMNEVDTLVFLLSINPSDILDPNFLPEKRKEISKKIEEVAEYLSLSPFNVDIKPKSFYQEELTKLYENWPNNPIK